MIELQAKDFLIDYYSLLSVNREDDLQVIKKAYRRKAMQFHPDRNPNIDAINKFKTIQRGYEILKDQDLRKHYNSARDIVNSCFATKPSEKNENPEPSKPSEKPKENSSVRDVYNGVSIREKTNIANVNLKNPDELLMNVDMLVIKGGLNNSHFSRR